MNKDLRDDRNIDENIDENLNKKTSRVDLEDIDEMMIGESSGMEEKIGRDTRPLRRTRTRK